MNTLSKVIQELENAEQNKSGMFELGEETMCALMDLLTKEREAAVPVAYMYRDKLHTDARLSLDSRFGNWSPEDIAEYEVTETKLYAAPPAQPVAVPDEMYWQDAPVEGSTRAAAYATGWNACRAAMLNQAPVKQPASNEGQP